MTEDFRLSKVDLLIQQKKFKEAEKILGELLTDDSTNILFLSYLAEVHLHQDKYESANSIIENAIGLCPDSAYLFYIKSRIALQQDKRRDAENFIHQAIELDPYDADYFAVLANIQIDGKQFEEGLETANQALEIDAENLLALNARSTALMKLNRSAESFETIEGALREDPNNAYTHANYGWSLLENGQHKKSLEHFTESLTNDPTFEYAQAGMLEAIKATNPIYRLFLKYAFFMSKLTAKYQWGVIIGFYLAFRALTAISNSNESLQPYLMPLIFALAIIAFSTWIISPISNLFLRFNKYGKFLLDKKEKISSNFVAVSLGIFIIGLILYFSLSDERMLTIAAFGFAMMLPLGTMLSPSKHKYVLLIYTVALGLLGVLAIIITFYTDMVFNAMSSIYIFAFVAFQWLANYMMIHDEN